MRFLYRNVGLFLLVTLLIGCIPLKVSGFRPSGHGTLEGSTCILGVKDRLRMPAPLGVAIIMSAHSDQNDIIRLAVDVVIPAAVSVQFLGSDLLIQSPQWASPKQLSIDHITAPGSREYTTSSILPGSSADSAGTFTLWFLPTAPGALWNTRIKSVSSFTVTIPPLSIVGQTYAPDPVKFDAYTEWGVYTCAQ